MAGNLPLPTGINQAYEEAWKTLEETDQKAWSKPPWLEVEEKSKQPFLELLLEISRIADAWKAAGGMRDVMRNLPPNQVLKFVKVKAENLPDQEADAASVIKVSQGLAEKAAKAQEPSKISVEDVLKLLGLLLGGASVATILWLFNHQNPATYHCSPEIIKKALQGLKDDDTRVVEGKSNTSNTQVLIVEQLMDEGWVKLFTITLTLKGENETDVEMSYIDPMILLKSAADSGVNIASFAERAVKRGMALATSGWDIGNIFKKGVNLLNEVKEEAVKQVSNFLVVVRMTAWGLIDKATKEIEDKFWATQDQAARDARNAKLKEDEEKAKNLCGACGAPLAQSATTCTQCNFINLNYKKE